MQNTKIEQSPLLHPSHSYIIGTEQSLLIYSAVNTQFLLIYCAVNTVSKNTQKSLLHANMVALLQLTALCPITAHNVPISTMYKIRKASFCINIFKWCTEYRVETDWICGKWGYVPLCLQMACLLLECIVSCTFCDPSCQYHWHMQICVLFVLCFCDGCYF